MTWAGSDCEYEESQYIEWFERQALWWRDERYTEWRVEEDMAIEPDEYLLYFSCFFMKIGLYFRMIRQ